MIPVGISVDFIDRWLSISTTQVGDHILISCTENLASSDEIIEELKDVMRSHYVAPEVAAKRLAELGAPKAAEILKEHLPITKTARSGDLGEILATELTERKLGFNVPVRRLRWRDGRNRALQGDDILAVTRDHEGHLKFLKGESKSRARLTKTVVGEAAAALDRDFGRPSRYSAVFIADHLREAGEDELANGIENALLDSFRNNYVDHLLFTVSGNDPNKYLSDHLSSCTSKAHRHAVGVQINNHGKFIERLFSEL